MILNLVCENVLLFYTVMRNNTAGYDCWSLLLAFSWNEETKNTNGNQQLFFSFYILHYHILCCIVRLCVSKYISRNTYREKLPPPIKALLVRNQDHFSRESLPTTQGLFQMMRCSARQESLRKTEKLYCM